MSNCIKVNISANEGIKAQIKAIPQEDLKVSIDCSSPLVVVLDCVLSPIKPVLHSAAPHIEVNTSNVCGVDFSWDTLYDSDNVALFDANNEWLLINIK